jgi:hypothetical protein
MANATEPPVLRRRAEPVEEDPLFRGGGTSALREPESCLARKPRIPLTIAFAQTVPTDARVVWGEAVGISVLSAGFKTLLGWLENSLGVTAASCC